MKKYNLKSRVGWSIAGIGLISGIITPLIINQSNSTNIQSENKNNTNIIQNSNLKSFNNETSNTKIIEQASQQLKGNYMVNNQTMGVAFDYNSGTDIGQIATDNAGRSSTVTKYGPVIRTSKQLPDGYLDTIILVNKDSGTIRWKFSANQIQYESQFGRGARISNVIFHENSNSVLVLSVPTSPYYTDADKNLRIKYCLSIIDANTGEIVLNNWDISPIKDSVSGFEEDFLLANLVQVQDENDEFLFMPGWFLTDKKRQDNSTRIITINTDRTVNVKNAPLSINNTNDLAVLAVGAFYLTVDGERKFCTYQLNLTDKNKLWIDTYRGGKKWVTCSEITYSKYSKANDLRYFNQTINIDIDEGVRSGFVVAAGNILFNYNPDDSFIHNYITEFEQQYTSAKAYQYKISLNVDKRDYDIESAYYHRGVFYCFVTHNNKIGNNPKYSLMSLCLTDFINGHNMERYDSSAFNGNDDNSWLSDKNRLNWIRIWDIGTNSITKDIGQNAIVLPDFFAYYDTLKLDNQALVANNFGKEITWIQSKYTEARYAYGIKSDVQDFWAINTNGTTIDNVLNNIRSFIDIDHLKWTLGGVANNTTINLIPQAEQPEINKNIIKFDIQINKYFNDGILSDQITLTDYNLHVPINEDAVTILKEKYTNNAINATDTLKEFNLDELIYIEENINKIYIQDVVKNWLVNQDLFDNYDQNRDSQNYEIKNLNIGEINGQRTLKVDFILKNAIVSSNNRGEKEFTIYINNFRTLNTDTKIQIKSINYNEELFEKIFTDDKAYVIDWKQLDNQKQKQNLINYINENLLDFFPSAVVHENQISATKVIDAAINFNDNSAIFNLTYSGFKDNEFSTNLTTEIKINLKVNPTSKSGIFNDFQAYLIKNINPTIGFPTENALKELVVNYLNNKLDELPNVAIPSYGNDKFSINHIDLNYDKIDISSVPIIIEEGNIKTKNLGVDAYYLSLPKVSIDMNFYTYTNDINASDGIEMLDPVSLVNDFRNNPSSNQLTQFKNWLQNNKDNIFNNLPNGANFNVTNIEYLNLYPNSLIITVNLSQANTANGLESNKTFSFMVNNFGNVINNNVTKLKITNMSWNDSNFQRAFNHDLGYAIDWASTSLMEKQSQLLNDMNNNLDLYFQNLVTDTKVESIVFNLSGTYLNAQITYSGLNEQSQYTTGLIDNLIISLRSTPGSDDTEIDETINPLLKFNNYLQTWVDQNHQIPTNNQLVTIATSFLNNIINELPDNIVNQVTNFTNNHIIINANLISSTNNTLTIAKGAIQTNTSPSLIFAASQVTLKTIDDSNISLNDINVDATLNKYLTNEIVYAFNQSNNTLVVNLLKQWIIQNSTKIFNEFVATSNNFEITEVMSSNAKTNELNISLKINDNNVSIFRSFKISNFSNIKSNTTLYQNLQNINYYDQLFKLLFNNDKGYIVDWDNDDITTKELLFKNNANQNIHQIFMNASDLIINPITNISIIKNTNKNNSYNLNLTYVGIEQNTINEQCQATITINLREFNIGESFSDFNNELQTWVNENNKIPSDYELKEIIINYINEYPDILPNIYLTNGSISHNDLIVYNNLITRTEKAISALDGAIVINKTSNPINIPAFSANLSNSIPIVELNQNDVWNSWLKWIIISFVIAITLIFVAIVIIYFNKNRQRRETF